MFLSIVVSTLIAACQSWNRKATPSIAQAIYNAATLPEQWAFWQHLAAEGDANGDDWFGRFTGQDVAGYPRPACPTYQELFGQDYAPDNIPDLENIPGLGYTGDFMPPKWERFVAPIIEPVVQPVANTATYAPAGTPDTVNVTAATVTPIQPLQPVLTPVDTSAPATTQTAVPA